MLVKFDYLSIHRNFRGIRPWPLVVVMVVVIVLVIVGLMSKLAFSPSHKTSINKVNVNQQL